MNVLRIIADGLLKGALERGLDGQSHLEAALVQLEIEVGGGRRSSFKGIESAIELARQNISVLAISVMGDHIHAHQADNMRWHAMGAFTHVVYRDGIMALADIRSAIEEVAALPIGVRKSAAFKRAGQKRVWK